MEENRGNRTSSKLTAKQWLLMVSSYTSVIMFFSILAIIVIALLIAVVSNFIAAPATFDVFFAIFNGLTFVYDIASILIAGMFFFCLVNIARNTNLTSNDKSNWRWFLIINWIFAIPEYYETFLAAPENTEFKKVRTLLRPRSLMFFKP